MNNHEVLRNRNPYNLVEKYGSPLYVYSENIIREKCIDMKSLVRLPNFTVNYSAKANSNLHILKIINEEGLTVDAMSPGEIYVELKAGFIPERILYISNNVSEDEFQYAIEANVKISVDSISQLEMYGGLNSGGEVFIRFNPGVGAGHHEKVITGGKDTKFGVDQVFIDDVKVILQKYNLKLVGVNQHIGSHFDDGDLYIAGVKSLLNIAEQFNGLKFIDFGGGFGLPQKNSDDYLNIKKLGNRLDELLKEELPNFDNDTTFMVEPGRYIIAESGILLGTVHAVKTNYNKKYIGTDLGFNTFMRPTLYDAVHEIEVFNNSGDQEQVTIVGNICESGDIITKDRLLPKISENDVIGIRNAGAYGYSMCSNYNNRLRPAEVLITKDGKDKLIRRRDSLEDLLKNYDY
jgi:diaminopimelate decarboxylase